MFYMVILRNSRERSPIMISSSQSTHCPLTWRERSASPAMSS